MQLIASHIVREFTEYEFHSLSDLAKQLKADYFGVVNMEIGNPGEKSQSRKKAVYMAYVKEAEWAAAPQYNVIVTLSFLDEEEVWTCVTEENQTLYMPAIHTMLNLYEKQDYPELLGYDCEHCIFLEEVDEATEDMVRDAVRSYVEKQDFMIDDDDIPF